jgi:ribose 5-phosphate isomerase B
VKIAIGSDHAGYTMKTEVIKHLTNKSIQVIDCGTNTDKEPVGYVDIAKNVCHKIKDKEADCGILICGTGIGMSIAANKVPGIRAGLCNELFTAKYAKSDVNINVLCLGSRVISDTLAKEIVNVWIDTEFTGGRFIPRIKQLTDLESEMRCSN